VIPRAQITAWRARAPWSTDALRRSRELTRLCSREGSQAEIRIWPHAVDPAHRERCARCSHGAKESLWLALAGFGGSQMQHAGANARAQRRGGSGDHRGCPTQLHDEGTSERSRGRKPS